MSSTIRGNDNFDSSSSVPSTSYGGVGSYTWALAPADYANVSGGGTYSASSLVSCSPYTNTSVATNGYVLSVNTDTGVTVASGTWRQMTNAIYSGNSTYAREMILLVRIS